MQLRCVFWQLRCFLAASLRLFLAAALRYSVKCKKEDGSILMHPLLGYLIAVGLVYYYFIYEDECFAVLGVDSDVAGLAVAG